MKLFKRISIALVAACTFILASCSSGVSQKYADKINDAAKDKEYVLVEDAKKKLGDDCINLVDQHTNIGILAQVEGCKTEEELEQVLNEGKTAKGIIIGVVAGKCIIASYGEINEKMVEDVMNELMKGLIPSE